MLELPVETQGILDRFMATGFWPIFFLMAFRAASAALADLATLAAFPVFFLAGVFFVVAFLPWAFLAGAFVGAC